MDREEEGVDQGVEEEDEVDQGVVEEDSRLSGYALGPAGWRK